MTVFFSVDRCYLPQVLREQCQYVYILFYTAFFIEHGINSSGLKILQVALKKQIARKKTQNLGAKSSTKSAISGPGKMRQTVCVVLINITQNRKFINLYAVLYCTRDISPVPPFVTEKSAGNMY
jgi:hypothetical protein